MKLSVRMSAATVAKLALAISLGWFATATNLIAGEQRLTVQPAGNAVNAGARGVSADPSYQTRQEPKPAVQPTGNAVNAGARGVSTDPRYQLRQDWSREEKDRLQHEKERHQHEVQQKTKDAAEKAGRKNAEQEQAKKKPCSFPCIN
jgi:hypothetical protein